MYRHNIHTHSVMCRELKLSLSFTHMQAMERGHANGATKSLSPEYPNFIQKLQVFIAFLKYRKVANSYN
jgi:hypothetical protein